MTSSNLCCTQPERRIDSPEPPARPLAAIDGIFATAVLAEDHPHALKLPERKAATDTNIAQSPNLTSKIKLQFRRSSLKDLKKGSDCDDDAPQMTLQEVLDDIEVASDRFCKDVQMDSKNHHDGGSHGDLTADAIPEPDSTALGLRRELNYSLPFLKRFSDERGAGFVEDWAAQQPTSDNMNVRGTISRALPKSISSPVLLSNVSRDFPSAARPISSLLPGDRLCVPKRRADADGVEAPEKSESDRQPSSQATDAPALNRLSTSPGAEQRPANNIGITDNASEPPALEKGIQLHQMDISQQLRSMSQLSDLTMEEASDTVVEPWSFHRRERSGPYQISTLNSHARQKSSSGMDSTAVPLSWGRVRTPVRDNTSSMYSRPASADVNTGELAALLEAPPPPEAGLCTPDSTTDWPLKTSTTSDDMACTSGPTLGRPPSSQRSTALLHPPHAPSQDGSRDTSLEFAPINTDHLSTRLLSPPPKASSIPSKSSSSILSKATIASRFFERVSPPKKSVRKRKSIFRFLRPGSCKHQVRSLSSPALNTADPDQTIAFDGPSDDPALLTVQYELVDHPDQVTRSLSMNQLGTSSRRDTVFHLSPPSHHELQRRPTLADYEKSLTVVGDDRRRPSTVNLERAKEIQDDDRRNSGGLRKRLSRARPLKDDASPLMAQALAKHQQEKALFRSSGKQRDSDGRVSQNGPVFTLSNFGRSGGSLPPPSLKDHNDLLDPLEKGHLKHPSERGFEHGFLLPPDPRRRIPSMSTSPAISSTIPSTVNSVLDLRAQVPQQRKKRIGTNLESWSRYPSHTRAERCGSAGPADAVLTRDFAVDVNHEEIHLGDDVDLDSPRSKRTSKSSGQRSRLSWPLRQSMGLGGVVRYYSNLFHTRGWYGQNRRTSVTTGGRLEYPELEMLPPQMAESPPHHHRESHPFQHLREEISKDASKLKAYVHDEEVKIGQFVRKEEKRIENLVHNEEVELEGLVRKKERKLEDFVKKEEDKFMHLVKEEEDKILHHYRPQNCGSGEHSVNAGSGKASPFRAGNVFEAPASRDGQRPHRSETMISPEDTSTVPGAHDGADDRRTDTIVVPRRKESVKRTQSKAEIWSNLYKDLLPRPPSPETDEDHQPNVPATTHSLKPRPAIPADESRHRIDPNATIRRFPSVTVIDDRKGHMRSVSLISVKTGRSTGLERSSTHDLLEVIAAREREEREKLLGEETF